MTSAPASGEPLVLHPFRYVDPVSGRWVRARYRAESSEIVRRYAEWEITGEPEIRRKDAAGFSPWR